MLPHVESKRLSEDISQLVSRPKLVSDSSEISEHLAKSDSDQSTTKSVATKREKDLKKRFLMEAPLAFKIIPPPRIVNLTSDFFEQEQLNRSMGAPPRRRILINTTAMNNKFFDIAKQKIAALKNFHGKMLTASQVSDFKALFTPIDDV